MSTLAQRMEAERKSFPALLPRETLVIKAWLKLHEAEYERFDYNMRIGEGNDPGPGYSDAIRRDMVLLSQMRVDAVAWKGNLATLLEVKDRATPSAVGQLISYAHVWQLQFPANPSPLLLLVCAAFAPNIVPAVRELRITLEVVDVDFSVLAVPKAERKRLPR